MTVRVASARGVPGTAGPLVCDASGARYLLCNHHVVLGDGAVTGDRVWALHPDDVLSSTPIPLGRAARGQLGRVTFRGATVFVDCALIALDDPAGFPAWLHEELASHGSLEVGGATVGQVVRKHGVATGTTEGRLIDLAFSDRPEIDGQVWKAPGQYLVDSIDQELNFSAPGDSGAALLDEAGRVLGLIWGCNAGGRGVACPIAPVLDHLGVMLGSVP